jgi:TRAP transporter TAXI family solute receptor
MDKIKRKNFFIFDKYFNPLIYNEMKHKKSILFSLMLLAFSSVVFGQMTILSGSKQATQYRYAEDIANIVGPSLDFKIVNQETKGSSDNFNLLIEPDNFHKLAIIQADYLYYMQTHDMILNTEKTKNLKVLVPLGYEQIHLVTKASKGYKGLKDLDKKVVAIGSSDQGTYTTANLIKDRSRVFWSSRNIHFDDCLSALNTDKIDAFFIVSSAPIAKLDLNPQTIVDKFVLIPLEDFNEWARYYKKDIISKDAYKWIDSDVPTFSVGAVLVVNESKLSAEERNNVLKLKTAIQSKFEELKISGHPTWKQVNLADWNESDWPLYK